MPDPFNFIFNLETISGMVAFFVPLFLLWLGGWYASGRPLIGFISSLIAAPLLAILFLIFYLTLASTTRVIITGMLDLVSERTICYLLSAIGTITLYLHYVFSSRGMCHMSSNHSITLNRNDSFNSFAPSPGTKKFSMRR
jgi:hypothetical protein